MKGRQLPWPVKLSKSDPGPGQGGEALGGCQEQNGWRAPKSPRGDCKQLSVGKSVVASPRAPALPSAFLETQRFWKVGKEGPAL